MRLNLLFLLRLSLLPPTGSSFNRLNQRSYIELIYKYVKELEAWFVASFWYIMILRRKEGGKVKMFSRACLEYWGYSVCLEILFAYDESSFSSPENKLLEKGHIHDWRLVSARAGKVVPRKYLCLAYWKGMTSMSLSRR